MIAIQYLHDKNFVYRDLKPNNVIIDQNKIVVLIDFDRMIKITEKKVEDENYTKTFTEYTAPEVNYGEICYESDIYSIGMMISFLFQEELKNPSKYGKLQEICESCKKKRIQKNVLIFLN